MAFGTATVGEVVNKAGSCSESAKPIIFARGNNPNLSAFFLDINTKAQAPSFKVEAFAAVTVPLFSNADFKVGIFSKFTFLNSSSSETVMVPFLVSMFTGTISSSKKPFSVASAALLYESIANESCASRLKPYLRAVWSAKNPIGICS